MATTSKEQRPATAEKAAVNVKDAARAEEEAKRAAAAAEETGEREPGDDLNPEDLAQFDG